MNVVGVDRVRFAVVDTLHLDTSSRHVISTLHLDATYFINEREPEPEPEREPERQDVRRQSLPNLLESKASSVLSIARVLLVLLSFAVCCPTCPVDFPPARRQPSCAKVTTNYLD